MIVGQVWLMRALLTQKDMKPHHPRRPANSYYQHTNMQWPRNYYSYFPLRMRMTPLLLPKVKLWIISNQEHKKWTVLMAFHLLRKFHSKKIQTLHPVPPWRDCLACESLSSRSVAKTLEKLLLLRCNHLFKGWDVHCKWLGWIHGWINPSMLG